MKREIKAYCGRRAKKIAAMLATTYDRHDLESSIKDCLADILHLIDAENAKGDELDFAELVASAHRHHNAEVTGGEHG